MTSYRHGLIIGKFYPPHAGHHQLIRQAARECARLTVVVMGSFAESIPIRDRVSWLTAEHAADAHVHVTGIRCDAPLDVGDGTVWAAQVASMRAAVRRVTATPVDAVFTAEQYGDELAARFSAEHRRTDRPGGMLTATAVRADLLSAWENLAAPTRAGLATRVVVVGAESTGTTTVARRLAEHYAARGGGWTRTAWVPEYGREFTEIKWERERARARREGRPSPTLDEVVWTPEDFDEVAREQTRRENAAARCGSPLLVCDTDAFATSVWERRYLGPGARRRQPWARAPELPRHDLYLVTDHEGVPWHDDGLREGDLAIRAAMTDWFLDALTGTDRSWVLLTGTLEQRIALAVRTVDPLLEHRMRFGAPFTGPGFPSARTIPPRPHANSVTT